MLSTAGRDALEHFLEGGYRSRKRDLLKDLRRVPSFGPWLGRINDDRSIDDIVNQVVTQVESRGLEADLLKMLYTAFDHREEELARIEILAFLRQPQQVFLGESRRERLLQVALAQGLHRGHLYAQQVNGDAGVPDSILAQAVRVGTAGDSALRVFQSTLLQALDNQLGDPTGEGAFVAWLTWAEASVDPRAQSEVTAVRSRVEALISTDVPPPSEDSGRTGFEGSLLEKKLTAFGEIPNLARWLERIAEVRCAVCRVRVAGQAGTGFLVAPDLVLTNHHVVSKATRSADVILEFGVYGEAEGERVGLHPVDWLVKHRTPDPSELADGPSAADPNPEYLDYALLRLAAPLDAEPIKLPAGRVGLAPGLGLVIVQHAEGKAMGLAPHPEAVISVSPSRTRIRYRVDTRGGSSGSPVFSLADWTLLALHHGTGRDTQSTESHDFNRGIPIDTLVEDLRGGDCAVSPVDQKALGIHLGVPPRA